MASGSPPVQSVTTHSPKAQVPPQMASQLPQLFPSVCTSTQWPWQTVVPPSHCTPLSSPESVELDPESATPPEPEPLPESTPPEPDPLSDPESTPPEPLPELDPLLDPEPPPELLLLLEPELLPELDPLLLPLPEPLPELLPELPPDPEPLSAVVESVPVPESITEAPEGAYCTLTRTGVVRPSVSPRRMWR